MTRIIKGGNKNFTIVSNNIVRDQNLTWKARGIFVYLYSQSDEWDFYETEVAKHSTDGRDSLRSGLKELEDNGYLVRKRNRNEKGQLVNSEWIIYDNPVLKKTMLENPMYDNSMLDNDTLRNTNLKNNNNKNNNSKNILSVSEETDHIPYKDIVSYLNEKANTKYRSSSSKTKRIIHARYNDGFTLDDFKRVIDIKCSQWLKDKNMCKYLRPETLFGSKFESYLNENQISNKPAMKNGGYGTR